MIVLPANNAHPSQEVLTKFGGDPVLRSKSVVKLHQYNALFPDWQPYFTEAAQGYPTVVIMQEAGKQAREVHRVVCNAKTNIADAVHDCRKLVDKLCPKCPQPAPTPSPSQPSQPSLPPLVDVPAEPEEDNDFLLFAVLVGGLVALVRYFQG